MALNRIIDRKIDAENPEDIGAPLGLGHHAIEYSVVTVWIVSTDAFTRCLAIE